MPTTDRSRRPAPRQVLIKVSLRDHGSGANALGNPLPTVLGDSFFIGLAVCDQDNVRCAARGTEFQLVKAHQPIIQRLPLALAKTGMESNAYSR